MPPRAPITKCTSMSAKKNCMIAYLTTTTNSVALACELCRPNDHRLSAKLVPTFAYRGRCVVRMTDLCGRNLDLLDRSCYFFFQVAPQLYSRGWVDPVPDPLLLRKSDSAGNRTQDLWICIQKFWPLDYRGGYDYIAHQSLMWFWPINEMIEIVSVMLASQFKKKSSWMRGSELLCFVLIDEWCFRILSKIYSPSLVWENCSGI
jgi:hypothetical protein